MMFETFSQSLTQARPPAGLGPALSALWWDAKGDWAKAHDHAQERDDAAGMHVHAYLHRKEGDRSNADYWYRRAGVRAPATTLAEEWADIVRKLLDQA